MARWRLTNAHYLQVPGNEWEYKEISRTTGKQARKVFEVPMLLDPRDAADHNYPEMGEIIVTNGKDGMPRDITFIGDPTPDMEPLDDDAKAISASFVDRWKHPIESLPGDYSQSILSGLERQIAELVRLQQSGSAPAPKTQSAPGVSVDEFQALKQQMQELLESNAALQAQLAEKAESKGGERRR